MPSGADDAGSPPRPPLFPLSLSYPWPSPFQFVVGKGKRWPFFCGARAMPSGADDAGPSAGGSSQLATGALDAAGRSAIAASAVAARACRGSEGRFPGVSGEASASAAPADEDMAAAATKPSDVSGPPPAQRHATSTQIPGCRHSTSALQGHTVDEPEALQEALRRSRGFPPDAPLGAGGNIIGGASGATGPFPLAA